MGIESKNEYIYIYMYKKTDSLCCTAKTTMTL